MSEKLTFSGWESSTTKPPVKPKLSAKATQSLKAAHENIDSGDAVEILVEQLKCVREILDKVKRGGAGSLGLSDSLTAPAITIVDAALDKVGLRYEHGVFVPDSHFLDKVSGEVIPYGHKWDAETRTIVPGPYNAHL